MRDLQYSTQLAQMDGRFRVAGGRDQLERDVAADGPDPAAGRMRRFR